MHGPDGMAGRSSRSASCLGSHETLPASYWAGGAPGGGFSELRFLSATRPAAAPLLAARPAAGHWSAVPIYIDRPGPIGAQHLLNMHDGHQSESAGAGPPRAVAKLGLLNCYYRCRPIRTELRICQHSRPGPRRSASRHWSRPCPAPASRAAAPAPIGCVGRRSPLCVNLRA